MDQWTRLQLSKPGVQAELWKGGDYLPNAIPKSEKATFYIHSDHHVTLDELKLKLRKKGVKTDKSQLVRTAIDFLVEQNPEALISRLESDSGE